MIVNSSMWFGLDASCRFRLGSSELLMMLLLLVLLVWLLFELFFWLLLDDVLFGIVCKAKMKTRNVSSLGT